MAKVQTNQIADLAISKAKIQNNAVDADKLDLADDYALTGTVDLTGGTLNVATPSADAEAASKGYVDNVAAGLKWKAPVRVRAQSSINLSAPGASIDGVAMNVDDRVLCDQQSTASDDGIYLWKGAAVGMVRAPDAQPGDHFASVALFVQEGTDGDLAYTCTNDTGTDVIGTDDLTFVVFSGGAVAHALGGAAHTADTLANLNSKVSDATLIDKDSANTFTEKQTFQSGAATDSPIALTPMAADPSTPANGDVWALSAGPVKARANGVTKQLDENISTEMHKVTAGEVTAGYFQLSYNPVNAQAVRVSIVGGIQQINKQIVGATGVTPDFDVLSTNQVHINNNGAATGLSGDIVADDVLIIEYQR